MIMALVALLSFYFGLMVMGLFVMNAYDKGFQDGVDHICKPRAPEKVTRCAVCGEHMDGRHPEWMACCSHQCARDFYD